MEEKEIIVGDFKDRKTGIRFLEDINGRLYCCLQDTSVNTPTPPIVNIPPIEIPPVEVIIPPIPPVDVNIPPIVIPPVEVEIPPVTVENPYKNSPPVILQSTITGTTWASTSTWNRINNSYGTGYVAFTTPFDKELHLTNIVINQTIHGERFDHSLVGLFKAGNLMLSFPVIQDINFQFFQPYKVEHSTFLEFKYKPYNNKLEFSILVIGYLV